MASKAATTMLISEKPSALPSTKAPTLQRLVRRAGDASNSVKNSRDVAERLRRVRPELGRANSLNSRQSCAPACVGCARSVVARSGTRCLRFSRRPRETPAIAHVPSRWHKLVDEYLTAADAIAWDGQACQKRWQARCTPPSCFGGAAGPVLSPYVRCRWHDLLLRM